MRTDGELVAYDEDDDVLWIEPAQHTGYFAAMQTDGNFVVYNSTGGAVWASGTDGNPGAWLKIQDDGNSVIYKGTTGIYLWADGERKY